MKKILYLSVLSILASSLLACGQTNEKTLTGEVQSTTTTNDSGSTTDASDTTNNAADTTNTYTFSLNGVDISCDEDFGPIYESLGQEDSYFEAASCAIGDKDKVYTYGSVEIDTYSMDGVDYVEAIILKDDTVETPEGIYIGSTSDEIKAAYGDDCEQDSSQIVYTKGSTHLYFILENDAASSIYYMTTALD